MRGQGPGIGGQDHPETPLTTMSEGERAVCWILVMSLFVLASGPVVQGPETVRFETDIGPATLDHRGHQVRMGIDCGVCHHLAESGAKKPCSGCHKGRVEARQEGGAPAYFDVKMKLCRGCHLEKREADRASRAPIHCAECHDIREKAQRQGSGVGVQEAGPTQTGP